MFEPDAGEVLMDIIFFLFGHKYVTQFTSHNRGPHDDATEVTHVYCERCGKSVEV